MSRWDRLALAAACAIVRARPHLDPAAVAVMAAAIADKLEEERAKRAAGSKPS